MPSLVNVLKNCPDATTLTGTESFYVIQENQLRKVTGSLLTNSVLKGDKGDPGASITGPMGPMGPAGTMDRTINLNVVSDYPLVIGETGILTLNAVTGAIALNVVITEGIYEISLVSAGISASASGSISIRPNGSVVTAGDVDVVDLLVTGTTNTTTSVTPTGSNNGTAVNAFILSNYFPLHSQTILTTYTNNKSAVAQYIAKTSATAYRHGSFFQVWTDVTTPWTTLGTVWVDVITFTGLILVRKRI